MPRCSCAGNSCSCLIQVGDGLTLTGTGNNAAPYTISLASQYVQIAHTSAGGLDLTDANSGTLIHVSLSGNVTGITLPTTEGMTLDLFFQQVTPSNTIVWPTGVRWAGGTDPTMTATATYGDWYHLRKINGADWIATIHGQAIR